MNERLSLTNRIYSTLFKLVRKSVFRFDTVTHTLITLYNPSPLREIPETMENVPDSLYATGKISIEWKEAFTTFYGNMCAGIPTGCIEASVIDNAGETRWFRGEYQLIPAEEGEHVCSLITFEAITERRAQHPYMFFKDLNPEPATIEALMNEATTDALTGLLARGATMQHIEAYLRQEGAEGTHALVMVDLDNLKAINDTMGHLSGDRALRHLADAMRHCFDDRHILGRIGGDEFFLFIKDTSVSLVERQIKAFQQEVQSICTSAKREKPILISCSIGISMYHGNRQHRKTLQTLYAEADAALYKIKSQGKHSYSFADDPELLLSAPSSSAAIAQNETISFNLRGLLNHFSSGIVIYHGADPHRMTPMFCNEGFLKLAGLTHEAFFGSMGNRPLTLVHPDDRDALKALLMEAMKDECSFQSTNRLLTSHKGYVWVTIFGNVERLDNDTFDVYIIFSDAEQMVLERRLREERYRAFMQKSRRASRESMASFHANLTQNKCSLIDSSVSFKYPVDVESTVDALLSGIAKNVASEEDQSLFHSQVSRELLLNGFLTGKLSTALNLPLYEDDHTLMWFCLSADIAQNPDTKAVEALISLSNVDRDIRFKYAIDDFLKSDYEFIGQIDVDTQVLTILGSDLQKPMSVLDYTASLTSAMPQVVDASFVQQSIDALRFSRIVEELEKSNTYVCTFPGRGRNGHKNCLRQWRCRYIGKHRKIIMITRSDMAAFLDGEKAMEVAIHNRFPERAATENARPNTILIADDSDISRSMLALIFEKDFKIIEAANGREAIEQIDAHYNELALILLDLNMSEKNGLHVLMHMSLCRLKDKIPVVMVTGNATVESHIRSYEYGIADIITKPYDARVVKRQVLNIIEHYAQRNNAEELLADRTNELLVMQKQANQNNEMLINALSSMVAFRDLESGLHIKRVQALTEIMLRSWTGLYPQRGFNEVDIQQIAKAAALHDIGKIAIPDQILLKPGKLTSEEFEVAKTHTTLGCNLLEQFMMEDNAFCQYCYDICRYHHERFDGRGYPEGLKGDEIPIWAQIVSVIDVFDALLSPRVYKPPYTPDKAFEMIQNNECGAFSPDLLACLSAVKDEILAETQRLADAESHKKASSPPGKRLRPAND